MMPNKVMILDKSFASQIAANDFFYAIRDKYSGTNTDIVASAEFDQLQDLYTKYCKFTDYPMKAEPVSFCVRNIQRGTGDKGGTTQGFVVKFSDGTESEFSIRKATSAIAGAQKKGLE
ncbi:hypothetical protein LCGC14_0282850 [marine sediment metagenome]|uniref:Uncharacterized protein n=1 Tax=marine sediment metagenome TaxID=412755 RepID=A0A0F9WGS7_9ZZZZ